MERYCKADISYTCYKTLMALSPTPIAKGLISRSDIAYQHGDNLSALDFDIFVTHLLGKELI